MTFHDSATANVAARQQDKRVHADPSPAVRFRAVGMTYESRRGPTTAIENVTGDVAHGRFVSVIGPSGCGKSTLLDIVAGLTLPTSGDVSVDGVQVTKPRREVAMVFQDDSTLHWRTVQQNVEFGLEAAGVGRSERRETARHFIDLVGLSGFESHHPRELSGGMKQRVAIARALALDPGMLLMDEPFGALDQQTRMFIGAELVRIWEATKKTVLFVTHDIQEAVHLSDEVWVMSHRPSVLREVIKIDIGRPRPAEAIKHPEFHRLTTHLWDLIREESSKTLGSGPLETGRDR